MNFKLLDAKQVNNVEYYLSENEGGYCTIETDSHVLHVGMDYNRALDVFEAIKKTKHYQL